MGRPPKIEKYAALLNAMKCFWEKGYRGTSMEDLESSTGLNRGSLYAYFGDKRSLFREAVHLYREEVVEKRRALIATAPTARKGIENFFAELSRPNGDGLFWGCLNTNTATELTGSDAEIARLVALSTKGWERYWRAVVRRGQRDGSLSRRLSVTKVARGLVLAVQGVNVVLKGTGDRAFVRGGIAAILDGVLAAPPTGEAYESL